MNKFYGQSVKESYKQDIEESRKQKTIFKNYEYFDDYSYSGSREMGVWLNTETNGDMSKTYFYLFQEKGPTSKDTLKKLFEWRRSGDSDEIGHKGGGNKRNLYGFKSNSSNIYVKDGDNVIKCETKPNKIYDLSISDLNEKDFRELTEDNITCTKPPEICSFVDMPRWYDDIFQKIEYESEITPNYLTRIELTEIPEEFTNEGLWNEYINQVRAKQYEIPIFFKNELLPKPMVEYESYTNIDLAGLDLSQRINTKNLELFLNLENQSFYFKDDDKFISVKDNTPHTSGTFIKWGIIEMFILKKDYLINELKKYNQDNPNTLRQEDFYGVYFMINNKLTSCYPIQGKILGDSRNNNIPDSTDSKGQSAASRFRMIIKPTCENNSYFDMLIQTCAIKAESKFLEKSPWKKIKEYSINFYKGESNKPKQKKTEKKKKPKEKTTKIVPGGIYVVYLGGGIYKFGQVKEYARLDDRIREHKSKSIEKVREFSQKNITIPRATIIYKLETESPCRCEEEIKNKLCKASTDSFNKIKMFQNSGCNNDCREYFQCDDDTYIYEYLHHHIIPNLESDSN